MFGDAKLLKTYEAWKC